MFDLKEQLKDAQNNSLITYLKDLGYEDKGDTNDGLAIMERQDGNVHRLVRLTREDVIDSFVNPVIGDAENTMVCAIADDSVIGTSQLQELLDRVERGFEAMRA